MAAIGIEHFRSVAATGVDRVALGGPAGDQVVPATRSFGGRVVAWVRNDPNAAAARGLQNQQVRLAFQNALIKAYGPDVANRVLTARFGSAANFGADTSSLSAKTISRVIGEATRELKSVRSQNAGTALRFLRSGGLVTRFQQAAVAMGIPPTLANDPGMRKAVGRAVLQHPEFGQRRFTNADIGQIAQTAIQAHFQGRQAQFEASHSGLAQLWGPPAQIANLPFKETASVVADLQARLQAGGALHGEPNNFAQHALAALTAAQQTPAVLGPTHAGQPQIGQHMGQLNQQWIRLHQAEANLAGVGGPLSADGGAVDQALRAEITAQKTAIESKLQFYNEYLENDTLSLKQAAYNKVIWAESGAVMIRDTIESLGLQLGDPAFQSLMGASAQMLNQAHTDWQQAPTNQRVDPEHPPFAQHKEDVKQAVKQAFRAAAQNAPDAATRRALLKAADDVGKGMKKARIKALNEVQTWQPVNRTMVVSRDGVTKSFRSEIIPASHTNSRVGHDYQAAGIAGVSAGTKDDLVNARNLQVSRLVDQNGVVKHQSIRHGVLDPWEAGSSQARRQAATRHADQVLHLAVEETSPAFKARLIAERNNPNPPQFKHTHVNFNLTTPVDRVVAAFNEGTFTKTQFDAFAQHNGAKQYDVFDATTNANVQTTPVDVDTITFSFGVNNLAQDPKFYEKPLNAAAWNNVYAHDKANLEKLVGDLQPGTAVGGTIGAVMDRLELAAAGGDAHAAALKAQIQEQVDIARGIFTSDDFRRGGGDNYKMVRHAMRVVDLSAEALTHLGVDTEALTQSQGCKSNKDRGGMADVEIKAMAIIEDMGGHVRPDAVFSPEDQQIYNTALNWTGQDVNQQWNTALPGSKNAKELAGRINDPEAQTRAMGFEEMAEF